MQVGSGEAGASPRSSHRTLGPRPRNHLLRSAGCGGRWGARGPIAHAQRGPAGVGFQAPGPWHLSSERLQGPASRCTHLTRSWLWPGDQGMNPCGGAVPLCQALVWEPGDGALDLLPSVTLPLLQVAGLCPPAAPGAAGLSLHPPGPGKAEQVAGDRVSLGALGAGSRPSTRGPLSISQRSCKRDHCPCQVHAFIPSSHKLPWRSWAGPAHTETPVPAQDGPANLET